MRGQIDDLSLRAAPSFAMNTSEKTCKVQNWSEYNDALVDRGRLTVWISEEAVEGWKADRPPQQGAQWTFSDLAVQTCLRRACR